MSILSPEIKYPIALAPMLGVVTPEMVAEVSNNGGLGNLPLGGQSKDTARELIRKTKKLTKKIFSVNLFANSKPDFEKNKPKAESMRLFIEKIVREKGWADRYDFEFQFYPYQDLIELIIEEGIKMVSFTFGLPDKTTIQKLKSHQVILTGNATGPEEASLIAGGGFDFVVAQGIEAGGHRATFINEASRQYRLIPLISLIKSAVNLPVIAAGGICNAETMAAAFKAGASAVQIGTHFIPASESLATGRYREALRNSKADSTVIAKSFSGRRARGIRNEFTGITERKRIPEYPIQNVLTKKMRALAKEHGDYEYASLWAGINARFAKTASTSEILKELISDYKTIRH